MRSDLFDAHCLVNILVWWITGKNIKVWKLTLLYRHLAVWVVGASSHLPQYQTNTVDVCRLEALETVDVQGVVENLWSHVSSGADPGVGRYVQRLGVAVVSHRQTKVCNGCSSVIFNQYVSEINIYLVIHPWSSLLLDSRNPSLMSKVQVSLKSTSRLKIMFKALSLNSKGLGPGETKLPNFILKFKFQKLIHDCEKVELKSSIYLDLMSLWAMPGFPLLPKISVWRWESPEAMLWVNLNIVENLKYSINSVYS